jgi:hypothetical protein
MAPIKIDSGYKKALKQFQDSDPLKMSIRSKSRYNKETKKFVVRFLKVDYQVSYPGGQALFLDNEGKEPEIEIKILLLHYLVGCEDIPLSGDLISFKGLPSSVAYHEAFLKRAINPISKVFSTNPEGFKKAIESLGGKEIGHADISFSIPVLPKVPLTYVLWLSDEELPGSANILFDSSASSHLPTEDLAVLGEITTSRLINLQQAPKQS